MRSTSCEPPNFFWYGITLAVSNLKLLAIHKVKVVKN